ncbi:MAG TPA: glycine dehydrogenase [Flavobacteriaceae bacterium]|nr:glycine dehydrogenase [Flavobacteriaceae bacterium]MAY53436.1 glycine dehydrogenase [Flavobacteriaceae bacterium]HBR55049.1 glycine dehydrogenase [Flavobacteriaceae bacterium]
MKFFIPCNEANHTCDKNQYKDASFMELVKLNIHLIYCHACRKYTARNTKLTKLFRRSNVTTMPLDQKMALKERLRQEMSK